jgi:hypothetical protein
MPGMDSTEKISNRRRKAGAAARIAGFLIVCVITYVFVSALLVPKDGTAYSTKVYDGLYENSVDAVFIGASTFWDGISPMVLWAEHGVTGYVFAASNCPPQAHLLMVKEALQKQQPKVIFLSPQFIAKKQKADQIELRIQQSLANRDLSLNKIETLIDIGGDAGYSQSLKAMFPLLAYHSNWKDIRQVNFVREEPEYTMGQRCNYFVRENFDQTAEQIIAKNEAEWAGDETYTYNRVAVKYYEEIVRYCNARGVEVVMTTMPLYSYDVQRTAIRDFAEDNHIEYLDFNEPELYRALGLDNSLDWRDKHHLNFWGSVKFSAYLGDYIAAHFDVADRREAGTPAADQWLAYYERYYEQFGHLFPGGLRAPGDVQR